MYLPADWTDDRERCRRVGIPDERAFATKPALAQQLLERTFDAGVSFAWVTGDSVYGDDRKLRGWLEGRKQAYVLAVSGKEAVWVEQQQQQVKVLLAQLPTEGWERLSAGMGTKGLRWYDGLRFALNAPLQQGWKRCLLLRCSITDPLEVTAYIAFAPADSAVGALVRGAGIRWTVEESIQTAKGEVGLDHYEVRSWTGWYRHVTLAMWAEAFLSVVRAERGSEAVLKKGSQQRQQQAVWQRSKPSASFRWAKLERNPSLVLAIGGDCRAEYSGNFALIVVATLASGPGTLLSLSAARSGKREAASSARTKQASRSPEGGRDCGCLEPT